MNVINYTEARKSLRTVLDRVVDDANYIVISRRDSEDAVVMSMNHFNSLMETVHLLKSPNNAARLAQSISEYELGKTVDHQELIAEEK